MQQSVHSTKETTIRIGRLQVAGLGHIDGVMLVARLCHMLWQDLAQLHLPMLELVSLWKLVGSMPKAVGIA